MMPSGLLSFGMAMLTIWALNWGYILYVAIRYSGANFTKKTETDEDADEEANRITMNILQNAPPNSIGKIMKILPAQPYLSIGGMTCILFALL